MSAEIIDELSRRPLAWLNGAGAVARVAVSSRIRLARNIHGHAFPGRASVAEREKALDLVRTRVSALPGLGASWSGAMPDLDQVDKDVLLERSFISRELCCCGAGSGAILFPERGISIMVNEEDHIRLQVLSPGLSLWSAWQTAAGLDAAVGGLVDYEFRADLGFLTACPTNVGTGLRASVMMHLPALALLGEMEAAANGLSKLGATVRGTLGEGSEAVACLYQVSNQSTLGESEDRIIERLQVNIQRLVRHEENARRRCLRRERTRLYNHVGRAYGILRHAHVLSSREAFNCLSALRLGVELGLFKGLTPESLKRLWLSVQRGHLQKRHGRALPAADRDVLRAGLVRAEIGKVTGK